MTEDKEIHRPDVRVKTTASRTYIATCSCGWESQFPPMKRRADAEEDGAEHARIMNND